MRCVLPQSLVVAEAGGNAVLVDPQLGVIGSFGDEYTFDVREMLSLIIRASFRNPDVFRVVWEAIDLIDANSGSYGGTD